MIMAVKISWIMLNLISALRNDYVVRQPVSTRETEIVSHNTKLEKNFSR